MCRPRAERLSYTDRPISREVDREEEISAAASGTPSGSGRQKGKLVVGMHLISELSGHLRHTMCKLTATRHTDRPRVEYAPRREKKEKKTLKKKNSGHSEAEQKSAFVLSTPK